jgi:hypothetical protein
MPLQWTISHSMRLVIAVAKGEMRPQNMIDFLSHLDAEGARPYAKIFGVSELVSVFTDESVRALANLVRARELESPVGPIKIFREWHEARRWIDTAAAHELRGVFDETVSGEDRPDGRQ